MSATEKIYCHQQESTLDFWELHHMSATGLSMFRLAGRRLGRNFRGPHQKTAQNFVSFSEKTAHAIAKIAKM